MKPNKELMSDLLANYSKENLIQYIINRWAYDDRTKSDLDWLVYESMTKKARELMEKSIADSERNRGNRAAWLKAHNDFDSAQRLYDKADKFYKENFE